MGREYMFTGYRYIKKNECQDTWSMFDKALWLLLLLFCFLLLFIIIIIIIIIIIFYYIWLYQGSL